MERPEDKRRTTISYIVAAVLLVAVVTGTQVYVQHRARQRAAANTEGEGTSVSETVQTETAAEEAETDSSYQQLTAEYSSYDVYRYRTLSDAEELASLGLPASVSDEDLGGKLATADNQIVLYAYPKYACRAVLIGNNSDRYSFCLLDSVTDRSKVQSLDAVAGFFGIYTVEDIVSLTVTGTDGSSVSLSGDEITGFYGDLSACTNTGSGAKGGNTTISVKIGTGNVLDLAYNGSVISALGESFTPSSSVKALIDNALNG